jgi:hypothetical protein
VSADSKAYATHSISHRGDKRGRYQCSKCDDYAEDLYMLASHETRCKGEVVGQRRFEGVYKLELSGINDDQGADTSLLIVARSSSHAPKSWYCGQEFLSDGLSIFAKRAYDYYQSDMNAPSALTAKFVALYDVHTRLIPTGEHSEAHTTNDPSIKSFFSRAHKFTSAIDQAFVNSSQHHSQHNRVLLSIGLDGFACHAPLVLAWLKRSPPFTLVIRETELIYGMSAEHFPKHSSGLFYGTFLSTDIEKSIESGVSVDRATHNLLDAWRACQQWKDASGGNNGRKIGRNGDHTIVPKKSKRGPKRQASC